MTVLTYADKIPDGMPSPAPIGIFVPRNAKEVSCLMRGADAIELLAIDKFCYYHHYCELIV